MRNPIQQIRSFYQSTLTELKKCTWPSRTELTESTIVVIVSTVILGLFVAFADGVLGKIVTRLLAGR
jgi:preprotein translocase subunit SecE